MNSAHHRNLRPWLAAAAAIAVAAALSACGSASKSDAPLTVRVGYFPNITHAPALVGVHNGIFAKAMKPYKLDANYVFGSGPKELAALLSGSLDIAFIGPVPALTGYEQSHGAISIIAGAASGGAELVTSDSITSIDQLKGKTVSDPALGGTQDIALRYYLKRHGIATTTTGGGQVKIEPMSSNGLVVSAFREGSLAGAWMPEPYSAEMVQDGGHVLVDEAKLWPKGEWATTNVVVRTAFLRSHPQAVKDFLKGLVDTLSFMRTHTVAAERAANAQLTKLTSKPLPTKLLQAAWRDQTFTANPLASTLRTQVAHAEAVGLLKAPSKLASIFDLKPLNQVLHAAGQPSVPGL